jgi:hypothetical protein
MTFETSIALIALGGTVLAVGGRAYGIGSWRLFVAACIPAAVVLGLAVCEIGRTCDHREALEGIRVLFSIGFFLSLTLYAATAVAGLIEGVRSAEDGGSGKAFWHVVGCLFASVLCGGVVLSAGLFAALHCYES